MDEEKKTLPEAVEKPIPPPRVQAQITVPPIKGTPALVVKPSGPVSKTPVPSPNPVQPAWMKNVIFSGDAEEDPYVRMLIYGMTGAGKTHFLGTCPGLFIIDTDHGLLTLKRMGVEYNALPIGPQDDCFKTVWDILLKIKNRTGPFAAGGPFADIKTLAIDSSTKLSKYILDESMRMASKNPLDDKADFTDWGRVRSRLENIGRLTQTLPCHVIVTALAQVEKNDVTGALTGGPMLDGKYRDIIGGDFDEFYFLESVPGKTPLYRAHFRKYTYFDAKSRLGLTEPLDDPTFDKIAALAKALRKKK